MAPYPPSLAVVAALGILGGCEAIHDILTSLPTGTITIDLGILLLPLGIGLLLRSNTCRVLLACLTLLALVLIPLAMCLIGVLAAIGPGDFYLTWFGQRTTDPTPAQVILSVAWGVMFWLVTLWTYRVLRSDRAKAACGVKIAQPGGGPQPGL